MFSVSNNPIPLVILFPVMHEYSGEPSMAAVKCVAVNDVLFGGFGFRFWRPVRFLGGFVQVGSGTSGFRKISGGSHQCSRCRSEFQLMSLSSKNSGLKMPGTLGGATLKVMAELRGIKSGHSMFSHDASLRVMLTVPCSSGAPEALHVGDRGVSGRSLLIKSLSCWG